jgi:hypothetical protein
MRHRLFRHAPALAAALALAGGLLLATIPMGIPTSAEEDQDLPTGPTEDVAAQPPPGGPGPRVGADPAYAGAVADYRRNSDDIGRSPSSGSGGAETAMQDCRSGKVNRALTQDWCYARSLKLYFNATAKTFLDPRTGTLLTVDPTTGALEEDPTEPHGAPPVLRPRRGAAPAAVSPQCTAEQRQLIAAHVQGLQQNAARTDSPQMRALFTQQAQWWNDLC